MAKTCKSCGAVLKGRICEYCGTLHAVEGDIVPQQAQTMQQQNTTNQQPEVHKLNYDASSHVSTTTEQISPKNKMVTLLLCFFFGVWGVHRFYVGKIGMGILYFFTAGLFGIGWIIDLILILTGSFEDGSGLAIKR